MFKFINFSLKLIIIFIIAIILFVFSTLWYFSIGLPDYKKLSNYQPPISSRVYSEDGKLIAEYALQKRLFVPYDSIPKVVINSFLSAEDKNFFEHPGIDAKGILRAVINNVKNIRDGTSVYSEIELIKKKFKELPENIKILDHKSDISTLSLFKFIDFCITVRGTVGMEASCYGIPVITAGTGRYDGLGYTIDCNSKKDYFEILSNINFLKKNSKKKKELAIKYLYCSLICKKLKTEIINFRFKKTNDAKLDVTLNHNNNVFKSNDVIKISDWLNSKNEDLIDYDTF